MSFQLYMLNISRKLNTNIPDDIITLISKYYVHINDFDKSIPIFLTPKSFKLLNNPIPSRKMKKGLSNNSLFSCKQLGLELGFWVLLTLLVLCMYISIKIKTEWWIICFILIFFIPCLIFLYVVYYKQHLNDYKHVINIDMNNINQRILVLNNLFNSLPNIIFKMNCFHISYQRRSDGTQTKTKIISKKLGCNISISDQDVVMNDDIVSNNDRNRYEKMIYHVDCRILLKFEDLKSKINYQKNISKYITHNISDQYQEGFIHIQHKILNNYIYGDSFTHFIIINNKSLVIQNILKGIILIFTLFQLTFLYKLPLYMISKKVKLVVNKYISINNDNDTQI